MEEEKKEIRLDKWLKIARIYKQRQKAVDNIKGGKVRVNGQRVKVSKNIKVGDQLTIIMNKVYRDCIVDDIVYRPIKAELARDLYHFINEEKPVIELSDEAKELKLIMDKQDQKLKNKYTGKSEKKDRRILRKYKRGLH